MGHEHRCFGALVRSLLAAAALEQVAQQVAERGADERPNSASNTPLSKAPPNTVAWTYRFCLAAKGAPLRRVEHLGDADADAR